MLFLGDASRIERNKKLDEAGRLFRRHGKHDRPFQARQAGDEALAAIDHPKIALDPRGRFRQAAMGGEPTPGSACALFRSAGSLLLAASTFAASAAGHLPRPIAA